MQDSHWELDVEFLEDVLQKRNGEGADQQHRVRISNYSLQIAANQLIAIYLQIVGIVFNCPHNPTGYCMSKSTQRRIVEIARQYDVFLFSDEVYRFLSHSESGKKQPLMEIAYLYLWTLWWLLVDEHNIPATCDLYHKAVSLGVMSKSFGLAGLRIGTLDHQKTLNIFSFERSFPPLQAGLLRVGMKRDKWWLS